ncbi:MAG: gliding motility-associated C-terminal domain-containing protein [Saprospiraceae bacterium]|nr:gliding motility-associated C-terminal domain-containing protein [Saprospiraceae bacterium]
MKRIVISLIWISLFSGLHGQSLIIHHSLEDSAFVCGNSLLKIEVENSSSSLLSNLHFQLILPSGTSYIQGSAVNATEFNLSIPHQPEFTLTPLAVGEKRILQLQFEISCSLFDQVNSGALFQNKLIFRHSSGIDSLLTEPPYRIETGFLVIPQVRDTIIEAGNQMKRTIQILNSRLGPIKEFTFTDQHDPLKLTSNSGTLLMEDLQNLQLHFSSKDFILIGDRDSLFERNESIFIEEILMDSNCQAKTIHSNFSVSWGCSQSFCQSDMETADVIFTNPSGNARLNFSIDVQAPSCHCEPEGVKFQMHIQNTGTRRADSLLLDLLTEYPASSTEVFSFLIDSFRIQGNASIISIETIDEFNGNNCAQGSFAEQALLSISPILPGQQITLHGRILISPQFNGNQFPFFYNYRYITSCKNTVSMNLNPLEYSVDLRKTQVISHILGTSNKSKVFTKDSTIYLHDSIRVNQTINDAPIDLLLVIPCGLILLDSSFILEGIRPINIDYDNTDPSASLIYLQYRPGFFEKKLHLLSIPLKVDCEAPCLKTLGGTSRRFITSCEENKNDTLKIEGLLCSELSLNCYDDGICSCGPRLRALFGYSMNCSSLNFQIDTIPAYAHFNSSIYRSNIYDSDKDGNRLNDGTGKADTGDVQLNRFITGDTLINIFEAEIVADVQNFTSDSIVFLVSHDLILVPFKAEMEYYNQETGLSYTCTFDSIGKYSSQGSSVVCGKIALRSESYGSGHRFSLPIDSLILKCGVPPNTLIKNGDRFKVKLHFKFLGNVNDRIYNTSIANYVQLFSRTSGFLFPYSCQVISHQLATATPGLIISLPATDIYYCNNALQLEALTIKGNKNLSDFFKNEFRPITILDSIKYFLPDGITLDTLWVYSSYFDSSGQQLIRKIFLLPQKRNGFFYVDPDQLKAIIWDESHVLEFFPHLVVDRCSVLKNDKVLLTFQYFISSGRDSIFWIAPDVQKLYNRYTINSSLEYRLLNPGNKLEFKQKELYISSNELLWDLLYPVEEEAGFLKIEMQSAKGLVDQFKIVTEPKVPINDINPLCILLGPFVKDSTYIFKMSGFEKSCEQDTLIIYSSWSCDSLALIMSLDTCLRTQIIIPVIPAKPELELDIRQEQKTTLLCDTLSEIMLEFFNANKGTAYQPELFIEIPNGITIIPNSVYVAYPSGSSFIPLPLPVWVNGKTYVWKLSELLMPLQIKGLSGIQFQPENSIQIKFTALTSCDIEANNYFIYTATGMDLCNSSSNTIRKAGNEIEIDGVTKVPRIRAQVKSMIPKTCENINPLLEIEFEMDQTSQFNDSCLIRFPKPLRLLENSFKPIQNLGSPSLVTEETADEWLIRFKITEGIPANSIIQFQFEVQGWELLKCGDHSIKLEFYTRRNAYCKASQMDCSVFIVTGQIEVPMSKLLTNVRLENLSLMEDSSAHLNINFDLLTSGAEFLEDSVLCVGLFIDREQTSVLQTNDSLVHIFNFSADLLKTNSRYNHKASIQIPNTLSCHYILSILKNPCICQGDTLHAAINSIQIYTFCDSLCFGDSLLLGNTFHLAKNYKWTMSPSACDTCQQQWYFSNAIKQVLVDSFVLELSENENCKRIYTYKILNFPPTEGLYTIEEVCRNQDIILDGGSRKNIFWSGPAIINPKQILQKINVSNPVRYVLHYTNDDACSSTDTFDFYFNSDTTRFQISPDTLIQAGDKASLYVTPGYRYEWMPAQDLSCTDCSSPLASPTKNTLYTVIITDSLGCKHALDVLVRLIVTDCEQLPIGIPNAFSPNGDQSNDYFRIRGPILENFNLRIANRWGEIVFETADQNIYWDGRYRGKTLHPDVFAYFLQFDCEGRRIFKKGNVSLLK